MFGYCLQVYRMILQNIKNKFMRLFHKHEFKKSGNTLWCKCGKIKNLPCHHVWKLQSSNKILKDHLKQLEEVWVCTVCGEHKLINPITGVMKLGGWTF